ncbi:hypothetical protein CVT24_005931 [Panaeolus cyanescens]|uniref:Alpha N-terminal protein methyltransferase 1 n=1 Tax=Panaeolus cyanescens TaxID=181874 RepID=A0A409V8Y5_9AGAR|nr:hypothetical protein CVT24_005931 [Panaeolus cyanescens]
MSASTVTVSALPDVETGIEYWNTQSADYDGVLGGYGTGTLPRVDALGSRLFLLNLFPELSTISCAIRPLNVPEHKQRIRALDVGAGVGRVTSDVLLHLVDDVVVLEPVQPFIQKALESARASESKNLPAYKSWPGLADKSKSVTLIQGTLQDFEPLAPHRCNFLDRIGYQNPRPQDEIGQGFDVIWCQWCLGHLTDPDLVTFFQRCKEALTKNPRSLIVVKENICSDDENGAPVEVFDEQDSSLTRSDAAWKAHFKVAGLELVEEKVQDGLPDELYIVKMYALR